MLHSSLRGWAYAQGQRDGSEAHLWHSLTMGVHDRLLRRQLWERFGLEGRGGEGRRELQGRTGWSAHCQFSSEDINLASNTTAHQKETRTPPPCVSHFISPPFSLRLLPRKRGWCRPLALGGGDAKSSPVSPLSHSWWAWHKKKEKWEPCWEREG